MTDQALGRLTRVDLRDIWTREADDFTPWLAREENLTILSETLGIDLELEAQEKAVGPFRADVLCKDIGTGTWVLIENQLERTDHGHLGQLLTYASGLEAVTIVWIAARFTEEHRSTLDWLNRITDESFRFFALEIELWRIGESPTAPKFNVVSKPNDWSRSVAQAARSIEDSELSQTRLLQRRTGVPSIPYWTRRKGQYLGTESRRRNPGWRFQSAGAISILVQPWPCASRKSGRNSTSQETKQRRSSTFSSSRRTQSNRTLAIRFNGRNCPTVVTAVFRCALATSIPGTRECGHISTTGW